MNNTKNNIATVKINNLGINGEGIAKLDDTTVFVPFALPSEEAQIKILKKQKNFLIGKLEKVLTESPSRIMPLCPVFTKCGGCQLQHLEYKEQLKFKMQLVEETLKKVGNITFKVTPCVNSDNEYSYRNKISLPVMEIDGEIKLGFFAINSHRIVEINACPLQQELTNKIISIFKLFLNKYKISAYNEETKKGLIKHLVAREFNGSILVAVVINGKTMPYSLEFYEVLKQEFKNVTLYLNHNENDNNVILGEHNTLIGGKEFLVENLQGLTVKTAVISFMQVNNNIRDKMYESVLNKVNTFKPQAVIDAYSGAGLLSGIIAKNANIKVYGLEIEKEAVETANKMLQENALEKMVENVLGDCTLTLPKLMSELSGKVTLVVDPPRKGLDKTIINAILESKPKQIIYIACGLTSLSRDLSYLLNTKDMASEKTIETPQSIYELVSVTPYDMFPQTKHVETLVELKLKEK